ncbi:MAG: FixH family protein [Zoogloeaceae bacterium]|jgi:hypothetical protein|nr:FixH family protein [Zoogloeaceae bacterium]
MMNATNLAMNANAQDIRPWYREPWPWILMSGPIIVVIAAIVTLIIAMNVDPIAMVEDDYYKQGLAINQRLHRDKAASELALSAQVMLSGREARVFLNAKDMTALPAGLRLHFNHPTREGQDQVVTLDAAGQGFYSGVLAAEVRGRWHVYLEDQDETWRLVGSWQPAAGDPLELFSTQHDKPIDPALSTLKEE